MGPKISQILKRLMFERQIRTTELAREIGLKQPTLHRIVEGTSTKPHVSSLKPLADYFSVTVDQLKGVEPLPWSSLQKSLSLNAEPVTAVPLLDWEIVTKWPDVKKQETEAQANSPLLVHKVLGENAFALVVQDSSMRPQFPEGTKLIVDPERPPKDRGFVVVRLHNQNQAIFRQLLIDGGQLYVKPLSPDLQHSKIIPLSDDDKICGTVVQTLFDVV